MNLIEWGFEINIKVTQHAAEWSCGSIFFTELMVEMYSKGLVRAIDEVLLM